jgi:TetR/AcrR family transcriptional regulator, cholesterol catabolism regulator
MTARIPDDKRRKQIVDRSRTLFLTRGISALSMDQIATLQRISKKTLYRFFPNKGALVTAAIEERMTEVADKVRSVAGDRRHAFPDRLRQILRVVSGQIAELGPTLVQDLYFHEPELWERIDTFRRERVFSVVTELFEEGMREGFIRNDIESRLVPLLFINALSSLMTPAQFVSLPLAPAELFESLIRILFGGVLTDDARHQFFSQEVSS